MSEEQKEKQRAISRRWRQRNLEKALAYSAARRANPEKKIRDKATARAYVDRNPERVMFWTAKRRAKTRNLPFSLTLADIIIPDVCPVLGIALEHGVGRFKDSTPTLDRIIPERGYVKGNVIVVSWRANCLKRDATVDELRRVADFYAALIGARHA